MQSDPSQVAADKKEHRHHREEELAGAAALGVAGYETYEVSKQASNHQHIIRFLCVCVCVCVCLSIDSAKT